MLVIIYHMLLFTDFVLDVKVRVKIGFSLVGFMSFILFTEIGSIFVKSIYNVVIKIIRKV